MLGPTQLLFASGLGLIDLAAWWLVMAESSPFHDYFLYHGAAGNVLAKLNVPACLVGVLISGNVHQPSEVATFVAMFVQWFVVGWLISVASIQLHTAWNGAR